MTLYYFIYITLGLLTSLVVFTLYQLYKSDRQQDKLAQMENRWADINQGLKELHNARLLDQRHIAESKAQWLQELTHYLQQSVLQVNQQVNQLDHNLQEKLQCMGGQVEKRLFDGLTQANVTYTDVVKRLALIDEAQKRIAELSAHVVNLQHLLADKGARGAFGEVQLQNLITNVLPKKNYSFQHTLSNGRRADCLLLLPPPTGNIAIDAKFPLENFRKLSDNQLSKIEKRSAATQFRQDIRQHVQSVATKYIIPNETAEGALLFIPAEAIFSEIHAHYYEVVEEAHRQRVWLVSPTTMMAVLTTTCAVLKDTATREQVHVIQNHLNVLAKDFSRFKQRIEHLSRHIQQVYTDIQETKTSADKITARFEKIEKVELQSPTTALKNQPG